MAEDTLVTCPTHGLPFNRAHYFGCEKCRGIEPAKEVGTPRLDVDLERRLRAGGVLMLGALSLFLGIHFAQARPARHHSDATGPLVVGLACAQTCAARSEECFVDCESVRDEACTKTCMPQLEKCAERCQPALQPRDGIAVITGPSGTGLTAKVQAIYDAWPPNDLPGYAYIRIRVDPTTGKAHDVRVQTERPAETELVMSTWQHADFPKDAADPHANEPGRRDAAAAYVIYVVMKP